MALLWCDGFGDVHSEPPATVYGSASSPVLTVQFTSTGGRGNRGRVSLDRYDDSKLAKPLGANYSTLINGFALKHDKDFTAGKNNRIMSFYDGASRQLTLNTYTADGNTYVLRVYNGNGTTLLGTSSGSHVVGAYAYIEIKTTFHSTTGIVDVCVDGASVLSLTGQDTINTANSYANAIYLENTQWSAGSIYSDWYICDTTGAINNDFLGDVKVDTYLPNSDGIYEDFTCSTGSDMFAMLDETNPDDDSTYIESSTVGHQYTVGQATPTDGTTIYGVMLRHKIRNTDAGTMKVKQLLRNNATDTLGGTELTLSASWQYLHGVYEADPSDSAAWQDADFSTAEFGLEITA